MKKNFIVASGLFSVIILIVVALAASQPLHTSTLDTGKSCALLMKDVITSAQGDVYDMSGVSDFEEPTSYYLASYQVQNSAITAPTFESVPADLIDEQKDLALQEKGWQTFAKLIPPQNREMVTEYNVFTDGFENTLAAVDQTKGDLTHWVLEVDIADLQNKDALNFTLIHEYGHVLTLNAAQMETDQQIADDPYNHSLQKEKAAACPYYFTGMGCSHKDSYINIFYNRFWVDINDEWQKIDEMQYDTENYTPYYNALYSFYKKHQDQFVDDYATTHPDEDIAESFTYFIFSPKPTGNSIKEQKILFFYEYPELVKLRAEILSGACKTAQ